MPTSPNEPASEAAPEPVSASSETIAAAAALLRQGGLVAFPTETVYGLGADATSDHAVARIFEAKGRPRFNPLIIHAVDIAGVQAIVQLDPRAIRLADAFWPGPLTLVLPRRMDCPVSLLALAGLDTVAVRIPDHPVALALLSATALPVAAPSANRSGQLSPTAAAHVVQSLGRAVDMVIDGGPCRVGIESTVIDLSAGAPCLLRPGAITAEALARVLGENVLAADPAVAADNRPRSPGSLARHYAPSRPLRINAGNASKTEALLAFGPNAPRDDLTQGILNLSPTGDLVEAAANLFRMLHQLDSLEFDGIAAMPVPERGLGIAINDRLRRAAAGSSAEGSD